MKINNVRISLTDQCNLNCIYCAPVSWQRRLPSHQKLSFAEIERILGLFVQIGINKFKLTGGEPLLVKDLSALILGIKSNASVEEVSLTTNGWQLSKKAKALKQAGLDRINLSLDSLNRNNYFKITKVDSFDEVYAGLQSCVESGFQCVKVNVVPMKALNSHEILDFVDLSHRLGIVVRFIELFSTNDSSKKYADLRIATQDIKALVSQKIGALIPINTIVGNGPAVYYRVKNSNARIGFISNFSENFCSACTRLRMDSQGQILPCLFSAPAYNLKNFIRAGMSDEEMIQHLRKTLATKSMYNKTTNCVNNVEMSKVGG